ncbi:hypothetical protein [Cellulomonas phragmiteti]|uniref:DUF1795 domain-containing protein n=1 Tax=Cellulomonas phragmiteti TaxID=478780 RepID=A0ABQ4DL61_9CELL|nr:hypothetical protein [Cellulomonas phragmiteti]GIG40082.1 hypothetical protein Cph01nite_18440 [Cellulomonas phragmiteti]
MSAATVEHPGPLLPGAPRFRFTLPDGWDVAPAPRALAVARPAGDRPGFVPNLTVTADLVPARTTAAEVLAAVLAAYPGEVDATDPGTDDDGHATSAHLHRPHPAGTVHQRVDVLLGTTPVPGDHRHALTVVSSWADTTPPDLRDALADAHTSVRFGTADPAPA